MIVGLVLLLLVVIGAPLFVIVGVLTALSLLTYTELTHLQDMRVLVQHVENLATKQEFLAIPLFMASGSIMTAGGIARRLVNLMRALLGGLPGGLAMAAVAACMVFAAISGSSPVTLIAVGSMMYPALVEADYPENFSLGLVTTAGSLGCLVPPSIAMLIYSISVSGSSGVDPSDLFLAGLMPALLVAGMLALYSMWVGRNMPRDTLKLGVREALVEGQWALALPVLVLGGIYGGFFTPTQAGAVAVIYALFVTIWVHRELTLPRAFKCMVETAGLMGTLLPIIVLAFGLNELLALIDVQEKLVTLVKWIDPSPAGFLLLVNVVLIVLGALMDSISATLIFAPLLAPMAQELFGIDPVHFGVIFVVNMEIGYLAPPVATNLFVASTLFRKPFGQVSRAVLPTLGITILALGLIIYIPTISLAALHFRDDKPIYAAFPWDGPPKEAPIEAQVEDHAQPADAAPAGVPSLKSLTGRIAKDLAVPTSSAAAGASPDGASPAEATPSAVPSLKSLTRRIAADLETKTATATP